MTLSQNADIAVNVDSWKTSIGGFLWLVHHADIVCTDSFHCTVFSILYEQAFQVFKRKQTGFEHMYGRIETLLRLTGLEECQYDGDSIKMIDVDYKAAKTKIAVEKLRSINWLRNALAEVTKSAGESAPC